MTLHWIVYGLNFVTQTFWLAVFYFIHLTLSILQKMATEELVTEQFQFLGIDVQKDVVTKCEYCNSYLWIVYYWIL